MQQKESCIYAGSGVSQTPINLFYVKGIKKLDIELITGETIPVSQPKRKEFMERLADYWGDFL